MNETESLHRVSWSPHREIKNPFKRAKSGKKKRMKKRKERTDVKNSFVRKCKNRVSKDRGTMTIILLNPVHFRLMGCCYDVIIAINRIVFGGYLMDYNCYDDRWKLSDFFFLLLVCILVVCECKRVTMFPWKRITSAKKSIWESPVSRLHNYGWNRQRVIITEVILTDR